MAGVGLSVLVETVQSVLPGRVHDLVDVGANTAGTALGIALIALSRAVRRGMTSGGGGGRRSCAALVAVPMLVGGLASCTLTPHAGPTAGPAVSSAAGSVLTVQDGFIAEGDSVSPFADIPAITNLDPALRAALQDAAGQAAESGVEMHVSSGWRSAAYQQSLLDAAVVRYGSAAVAGQYVLSPERSAHVRGRAVDVGPTDAMSWLAQHGADVGLCQIYANEMWHFELATAPGGRCPEQLPSANAG